MNRRLAKIYKPGIVKFALNIWPPFWGAGIKILHISQDFRTVKVRLSFAGGIKMPIAPNMAAVFSL